jgi:hypothetical protein
MVDKSIPVDTGPVEGGNVVEQEYCGALLEALQKFYGKNVEEVDEYRKDLVESITDTIHRYQRDIDTMEFWGITDRKTKMCGWVAWNGLEPSDRTGWVET